MEALTCPSCLESVEPTPSGMYRHTDRFRGTCGFTIIDDARRADGTYTSDDPED